MNTGDKLGEADARNFIANFKSATQEQDRAAGPSVCIDFQVMANAPPEDYLTGFTQYWVYCPCHQMVLDLETGRILMGKIEAGWS